MNKLILFAAALSLFSCGKDYVTPEQPEFQQNSLDSVIYQNGYSHRGLNFYGMQRITFYAVTPEGEYFESTGDWVGSHFRGKDSIAEIWSWGHLGDSLTFLTMLEVVYTPAKRANGEGIEAHDFDVLATIEMKQKANPTDSVNVDYEIELLRVTQESSSL